MTRTPAAPSSHAWRANGLLQAFVYLTWASTWPVGKWALQAFTPLGLITVRHALAGGVLLIVGVRGKRAPLPMRSIVLVGILQYFAYYFLSYVALSRLDSGTVALASGCYPMFVALLARRNSGARGPTAREWLALGSVVAGGILIALAARGSSTGASSSPPLGLYLAAFSAALCLALATEVSAQSLRSTTHLAETCRFVGSAMLVGSVVAFSAAWFARDPWLVERLDWAGVAALGHLTLLGSVGVFLVHTGLLRSRAAWRVAAGYPLVPALSVLLGAILLGEVPSPSAVPGMLVMFAGLVALSSSRRS